VSRFLPRFLAPAVALAALGAGACKAPEPKAELEISGIETYWVVDAPKAGEQYIAPAIRFELHNKGHQTRDAILATATFYHKGQEGETWGSDWQQVVPAGRPLKPGGTQLVVMRSDARYHSAGAPESMFQHEAFQDATVEVFLRLGSSAWVKFGRAEVERRIGSRSVQADTR
jgi:hypothetical protein